MQGFVITVEVEDVMSKEVLVTALPPTGSMMSFAQGSFKVREIEFLGVAGTERPLEIKVRCVPVLNF